MGRQPFLIRRLFAVMAIAWVGALPVAALIASRPAPGAAEYVSGAMIYAIGSVVCHQLPNRSFHLWGRQLPVCARCLGIYAGAAVMAMASFIRLKPWRLQRAPVWFVALAGLPTIATLVFEWTTGIMPSNSIRAAAGFVLGGTVAVLIVFPGLQGGEER